MRTGAQNIISLKEPMEEETQEGMFHMTSSDNDFGGDQEKFKILLKMIFYNI